MIYAPMRAFIRFSILRYLEPTGAMTRACLAIMVLAMAEASIFKRSLDEC